MEEWSTALLTPTPLIVKTVITVTLHNTITKILEKQINNRDKQVREPQLAESQNG